MTTNNYEQQAEKFKDLQVKTQKISEGVIRFNAQVENHHENYKKVVEIANSKFKTSSIEELIQIKEKWLNENQASLAKCEEEYNKVKQTLEEKTLLMKQIQQD